MMTLKYQHRAPEIMHYYRQGLSIVKIGRTLRIPQNCVFRVVRQHVGTCSGDIEPQKHEAPAKPKINVLDLDRKDGALIPGHYLIEQSLWAGLEHWKGLH